MRKITKSELINKGAVYAETVLDGFNRYKAYQVRGSLSQYQRLLKKLFERDGLEYCYADFYHSRITEENKTLFRQYLSEDEWEMFLNLRLECQKDTKEEYVILELEEKVWQLLLKISFKELLFSTFYFTKSKITCWTNYDGEFVFFIKKEEELTIGPLLCEAICKENLREG